MQENDILGVYTITNTMALYLVQIEYGINDYAIFRFSDEEVERKAILNTTQSGKAYFRFRGARYYLDEFMRI